VHIKRIDNAERQFIRLALPGEASRLFYRDDLAGRLELIQIEDEELVDELADGTGVGSLGHVVFFDYL